jgi:hypothetical protein
MRSQSTTYLFRFPEAKRAAIAAVEAALKHDRAEWLKQEILLLRIHLTAPRSPEIARRAEARIAELDAERRTA